MANNSEEIFFAEEESSIEKERENWKVLIVDDEKGVHTATKIAMESFLLDDKGLSFISAYSGGEAKQLLEQTTDIAVILLDVVMETDNAGLEVVQYIREVLKNKFVRIILRTGQPGQAPEEETVVSYDINDYKTKTELTTHKLFTAMVACIRSYTHLKELDTLLVALEEENKTRKRAEAKLREHRDQLEKIVEKRTEELRDTIEQLAYRNQEMEQEQEFAQKVFANIINPSFLNVINIKYLLSPMSIFNGDLLFVGQNLSGGQTIMLGDFTGHGLRAALGAIPVADIFRTMLTKGFAIEEIVFEINQKLKNILPTGVFCCACFIEIDTVRNKVMVWNGGLPPLLIHRENQGIIAQVKSSNPPLGILGPAEFDNSIEIVDIKPNDRIYIYSDGIIECENQNQELFGQERLDKCFMNNNDPDRLFDEIMESVSVFGAGNPQSDDITIIEVSCPVTEDIDKPKEVYLKTDQTNLMKWKMVLDLNATVLRTTDPIPILTQFAIKKPEFKNHKSYLFTIIQELLTNSIDHGVLCLDSSLKNKTDGFSEYYQERKKALDFLEKGWIKVDMEHIPMEKGGKFILKIEDSGPGFDYTKELSRTNDPNPTVFSGRGIIILRSLCDKLTYSGNGNKVEAVFVWG